jgi:peptidoglycan/xylan/chitin deacetylase (PgdA/CDA1 family)
VNCFRLPYGKYNQRVLDLCEKLGFVVTVWNIDTVDYKSDITANQIVNAYESQFVQTEAGKGRFISLHHDIANIYYDQTTLAKVFSSLKNYSYTTVTLDQCLGTTPYLSKLPDTSGPGKVGGTSSDVSPKTSFHLFGAMVIVVAILFSLM